jgi:hypothetical protein
MGRADVKCFTEASQGPGFGVAGTPSFASVIGLVCGGKIDQNPLDLPRHPALPRAISLRRWPHPLDHRTVR